MQRRLPLLALLFLVVMAIASCGGGGGGGESTEAPPQTFATVSGSVVKGPVTGAQVTFHTMNADGSRRSYYGPISTDSSGNFSATLTPAPTDPLDVVATGGSYVDEATGAVTTLAPGDRLTAVWPAGTTRGMVTPLTDLAAARVRFLAPVGTPSAARLATAIASSNICVARQYGIENIVATTPAQVDNPTRVATATRAERNYGLVLAGIAQYASALGVRPVDLVGALAADARGGMLNGSNDNAPITMPRIAGGTVAMPASAGTTNLQDSINSFIGSARNRSGLTQMPITLTPVPLGLNAVGTLYTTSTVLPAAISGNAYTADVTATGGTPPYRCTLKAGSTLPAGYALVPGTCKIQGTAELLGGGTTITYSSPFTITLTDSATPPASVEVTQYLTTDIPPPTISGTSGDGTEGAGFTLPAPTATGGSPPYHFMFDSFMYGTPPLGATVDLFTGAVTVPGTAKAGNYTFRVCAVDLGGRSNCTNESVTIHPAQTPPPIPPPPPPPSNGVTGIAFSGGVGGWGAFVNVKITPSGLSGISITCDWAGNMGSKATRTTTTMNSNATCSNSDVASWPDGAITITATVTGTSLKTSIVY